MPRTIDREQRRRQLADAVWRLLERGGLEGASVRAVATEAGLSTGSVRHFFSTQAELHLLAMTSLTDRVSARIAVARTEPDIRRRALAMIGELMPLREQTRRELSIWWEFVQRSRHEPALGEIVADQARAVRDLLQHMVEGLIELGFLASEVGVDQQVRELNAVIDGLTFQLLTVPGLISAAEAAQVLEIHLFGSLSDRQLPPAADLRSAPSTSTSMT